METEKIVNQAGEKIDAVHEDKCLTDDSKVLEEKLASQEESKVETLGGSGENVTESEDDSLPAGIMEDEEKAANEEAESKDLKPADDVVHDLESAVESLDISEEVDEQKEEYCKGENVD